MAGASDGSISILALWSTKGVSLIVGVVADDALMKGGRTKLRGVRSLRAGIVQGRSANDAPIVSRIVATLSSTCFVYVSLSVMTSSGPLRGSLISRRLLLAALLGCDPGENGSPK